MKKTTLHQWIRTKWRRLLTEAGKRVNYGIRPYDRDWDVLIILDACRYDLFQEFAPGHVVYDEFDEIVPVYSCASSSDEWVLKSFEDAADQDVSETCYVTGNAYTHLLDLNRFHEVVEVWKFGRDPRSGSTLPELVTNEAVRTYRKHPDKRHIVHYLQPHAPFLHCRDKYVGRNGETNVWKGLEFGDYVKESVWEDYGKNLQTVLDHVEIIVKNVEGKVEVTADHGNLMGEYGLYGHPSYVLLPALKRVPWATATGCATSEYVLQDRDQLSTVHTEEPSVKEHLRQLGYAE